MIGLVLLSAATRASDTLLSSGRPPTSPVLLRRIVLPNGVALEYLEQGPADGIPVILIHGWPDSVNSFDRLRPLLSTRLRVFTVGLRGFGGSDKPPDGYSIPQFAADVRSFCEAKAIRRAVVVGHSMGSIVAHALASRWPRLVSDLVLVDACRTARDSAVLAEVANEINAPRFSLTPEYVNAFQTSSYSGPPV